MGSNSTLSSLAISQPSSVHVLVTVISLAQGIASRHCGNLMPLGFASRHASWAVAACGCCALCLLPLLLLLLAETSRDATFVAIPFGTITAGFLNSSARMCALGLLGGLPLAAYAAGKSTATSAAGTGTALIVGIMRRTAVTIFVWSVSRLKPTSDVIQSTPVLNSMFYESCMFLRVIQSTPVINSR